MTAAKVRQLPAALGRFQLGPMIGQGGMGAVYRATDTQSGDHVAIKVVTGAKHTGALRSEIETLRGIHHPGVVRIVDEGQSGGVLWYAMELLEGRTLAELHQRTWHSSASGIRLAPTSALDAPQIDPGVESHPESEPTPEPLGHRVAAGGRLTQTLQIYHRLCGPLGHMHSRGLVHKDLKPSNVFITSNGTPVLMDFGLATLASAGAGREALGRTDSAFGTVGYASPEQIRRELVDARADLYSLGCLLYESLTGTPPFEGDGDADVLRRHLEERPSPPSTLVAGVPPELDRLVLALLEKSRVRRVGHANEVAARLEHVLIALGHDTVETVRAPAYLYRPQLIGREALLSRLVHAAHSAESGQGRLFLVQGESGIGKTFFVTEFVRRIHSRKARVITGECLPGGVAAASVLRTGGTLAPFRQFLQAVADQCRSLPLETAQRLLGQEASALSPYDQSFAGMARDLGRRDLTLLPSKASRERVFRALETLLTNFAQLAPLSIVIDDLQWADDLSLAFLARVRERLRDRAILIVATCRAEEMPENVRALRAAPGVETLTLERLGPDAVQRVITEMLAMAAPPEDLVSYVARQSEGNPFFIGEHLRMLYAEGLLVHEAGRWLPDPARHGDYGALPLPNSLQQLVLLRLSRLAEPARGAVQAGAVLGRMFTLEIVQAVCGLTAEETEERLADATNGQVLEALSDKRFRFAHDKLREFAYADIPEGQRRELHLRAASTLEAEHHRTPSDLEVVTMLLQHFRYARRDEKTLHYLGVAGELALAQSAHQEAIEFLSEAIEMEERWSLPGRALRLARWERQIGEALQGLGDLVESMNHLERAATHLGRPLFVDTVELAPRLGYEMLLQATHRLLPLSVRERRMRDDPEQLESARIHDLLLQVCLHRGDLLRGLFACLRTLNLTELTSDSPARAVAYSNMQVMAGLLPWRALTEAYGRQAKATLSKVNDPLAASYHHLTQGAYRSGIGEWQAAQRELERSLDLALEMKFSRRVGDATAMLGVLAYHRGEFDDAHDCATRLLDDDDPGDVQLAFRGRLGRAQVSAARGQFDEVLDELGHVSNMSEVVGIPDRIWAYGLLALAYAALSRHRDAQRAAQQALFEAGKGAPSAHHAVAGYGATADALLKLWEAEKRRAGAQAPTTRERRQACQRAVRALATCGRVYPIARPSLAFARGRCDEVLDRPTRARDHWLSGLRTAETLGMPYEQARLHLALSKLADGGAESTRRTSGERARELCTRLGIEMASL